MYLFLRTCQRVGVVESNSQPCYYSRTLRTTHIYTHTHTACMSFVTRGLDCSVMQKALGADSSLESKVQLARLRKTDCRVIVQRFLAECNAEHCLAR